MSYEIGNVELQPFSTSEVIWRKEDLRLVGGQDSPDTIVRALKFGETALFDYLETLLQIADKQFQRVAELTGTAVVRRHCFGIAKLPKAGLSAHEKNFLRNPYLEADTALVVRVDVIQQAGRISDLEMERIQQGATMYLKEQEGSYYWGDLSKGKVPVPPFAIRDQYTYGTPPKVLTPMTYLTDIDPIIFKG